MASTWKNLYDDMLQHLLLYTEDVKMTEQQGMRYLTQGMEDFQRRVRIVEGYKNIAVDDPNDISDPGAVYVLGDDVLEIQEVHDLDGYRLVGTNYKEFTDIIERSDGLSTRPDAPFHETPVHFSRIRRRPNSPINSNWDLDCHRGSARIWTTHFMPAGHGLLRWPANPTDTSFNIRYIVHLHPFSDGSSQWTAWYVSDAAFEANFIGTGPDDRLAPYERAFVLHAVSTYLRSVNKDAAYAYQKDYEGVVAEAIANKPEYVSELVAPYNHSPYSS